MSAEQLAPDSGVHANGRMAAAASVGSHGHSSVRQGRCIRARSVLLSPGMSYCIAHIPGLPNNPIATGQLLASALNNNAAGDRAGVVGCGRAAATMALSLVERGWRNVSILTHGRPFMPESATPGGASGQNAATDVNCDDCGMSYCSCIPVEAELAFGIPNLASSNGHQLIGQLQRAGVTIDTRAIQGVDSSPGQPGRWMTHLRDDSGDRGADAEGPEGGCSGVTAHHGGLATAAAAKQIPGDFDGDAHAGLRGDQVFRGGAATALLQQAPLHPATGQAASEAAVDDQQWSRVVVQVQEARPQLVINGSPADSPPPTSATAQGHQVHAQAAAAGPVWIEAYDVLSDVQPQHPYPAMQHQQQQQQQQPSGIANPFSFERMPAQPQASTGPHANFTKATSARVRRGTITDHYLNLHPLPGGGSLAASAHSRGSTIESIGRRSGNLNMLPHPSALLSVGAAGDRQGAEKEPSVVEGYYFPSLSLPTIASAGSTHPSSSQQLTTMKTQTAAGSVPSAASPGLPAGDITMPAFARVSAAGVPVASSGPAMGSNSSTMTPGGHDLGGLPFAPSTTVTAGQPSASAVFDFGGNCSAGGSEVEAGTMASGNAAPFKPNSDTALCKLDLPQKQPPSHHQFGAPEQLLYHSMDFRRNRQPAGIAGGIGHQITDVSGPTTGTLPRSQFPAFGQFGFLTELERAEAQEAAVMRGHITINAAEKAFRIGAAPSRAAAGDKHSDESATAVANLPKASSQSCYLVRFQNSSSSSSSSGVLDRQQATGQRQQARDGVRDVPSPFFDIGSTSGGRADVTASATSAFDRLFASCGCNPHTDLARELGAQINTAGYVVVNHSGPGSTAITSSSTRITAAQFDAAADAACPSGSHKQPASAEMSEGGCGNDRFPTELCSTSIPGLFAAGEVTGCLPLDEVCEGQGAMAAAGVNSYLCRLKREMP